MFKQQTLCVNISFQLFLRLWAEIMFWSVSVRLQVYIFIEKMMVGGGGTSVYFSILIFPFKMCLNLCWVLKNQEFWRKLIILEWFYMNFFNFFSFLFISTTSPPLQETWKNFNCVGNIHWWEEMEVEIINNALTKQHSLTPELKDHI